MYQKPAMLTIVPKSNLDFVADNKDDNGKDDGKHGDGEKTWSQVRPEMEKSQPEAEVLPSPLTSLCW